jgi:hypothetical protein
MTRLKDCLKFLFSNLLKNSLDVKLSFQPLFGSPRDGFKRKRADVRILKEI